ncbi:MAG: glycosyltransferase family A protein [Bacteroidales bacterium]
MYKHTIFTPIYNRSQELPNVYDSICKLDYPRDKFEWIIIDDGSTDEIEKVLEDINKSNNFIPPPPEKNSINIRCFHKENGGIHTAQNMAITKALGEYITRIDSDDILLPNALKEKDRYLEMIPTNIKDKVIGVVGLCLNKKDGSVRGTLFPNDFTITTGRELRKLGAKGDRNFCMKTTIMRKFLIPEYTDTKWVPEGNTLWIPIDKQYLTVFVNTPFSICSEPSPTSMMGKSQVKSPESCMSRYYQEMYYIANDDTAPIINILKSITVMWVNSMCFNSKTFSQVITDIKRYRVVAILLYLPAKLLYWCFYK